MTLSSKDIMVIRSLTILILYFVIQLAPNSALATPFAYVPNRLSNNVSVIDVATNKVVDTINVGVEPVSTAENSSNHRLYVVNTQEFTVSVIDTMSRTVISTIPVGMIPWGIAVNPAGPQAYVTNTNDDTMSVINTATNTVIATIPVGFNPMSVAVNPSGTRVYVGNYGRCYQPGQSSLTVIDTSTNAIVTTINFENFYGAAYSITTNGSGSLIFVSGSDGIKVIDATSNSIINTIKMLSGSIAYNDAKSQIYATNHNDSYIWVIDAIKNSITGTIYVGSNPEGIAVDPSGTRLYVANYGSNNVSVIDTSTSTVISTTNVGEYPGAGSISIGTGWQSSVGGTQVPVMEGWWLLPGMLAGVGMFVRKRKEY